MNILVLYMSLIVVIVIAVSIFAMSLPFSIWGLRYRIQRMKLKSDLGLLWLQNKAGDFSLPHFIDLRKEKIDIKIGGKPNTYTYTQDQLVGAKFYGCPTVFYPVDDSKTSIGLYYQQSDEYGNPKEESLSAMKPSVSLRPSIIKALVDGSAISQVIQDLFSQYKTQIYILAGIGIGLGLCVFFTYEVYSTSIPAIISKLDTVISLLQSVQADKVVLP